MKKIIVFAIAALFGINSAVYSIDAWIRINQLGYLPYARKKAVLLSETPLKINQFAIYDALTNEKISDLKTVYSYGEFSKYKSCYILDFSSFHQEGAFYIKANLVYSPTIYINKNIYLGGADFMLNYLRDRRFVTNPSQVRFYESLSEADNNPKKTDVTSLSKAPASSKSSSPSKENPLVKAVSAKSAMGDRVAAVSGGWFDDTYSFQSASVSANIVFQLMFAYQMCPTAFDDKYQADGAPGANAVPDILDEARWGLKALVEMYPSADKLYHQIGNESKKIPGDSEIPVYEATGRPQGENGLMNNSTGKASVAGKFAAAFALGSELFQPFDVKFSKMLSEKALSVYRLGKKSPGVTQFVSVMDNPIMLEENWSDDMQLAATQLFWKTYEQNYLLDAADYGRREPVTPWMCSDTAHHYQWYPFVNVAQYQLALLENPRYKNEYRMNMLNGLQRVNQNAQQNPFHIGVPLINGSNLYVAAMATQCRLYRALTADSTYLDMENSLVDWLFGCNPWGTSMIISYPHFGTSPGKSFSKRRNNPHTMAGALVNGAIHKSDYIKIFDPTLSREDAYERFQSDWAVFHDSADDDETNKPTADGTASLCYLLSMRQKDGVDQKTSDQNEYIDGGLVRTDPSKKQICLVFAEHDKKDGFRTIYKVLKKQHVKASFFFTGDFLRKSGNGGIVRKLKRNGFYIGAHSDKNRLFNSTLHKDSLAVTKAQFVSDLKANFKALKRFGLDKQNAPFYLPPQGNYNQTISSWVKEYGLYLLNSTPGTLSGTDISLPEMRNKYYSGIEIYNRIMEVESKQQLNGYILLFHLGSDKARKDKFYTRLNALVRELKERGYTFADLHSATDLLQVNPVK